MEGICSLAQCILRGKNRERLKLRTMAWKRDSSAARKTYCSSEEPKFGPTTNIRQLTMPVTLAQENQHIRVHLPTHRYT